MHLAINYSLAAAKLVKAGVIDIDYFKAPDWDWLVNDALQLKPVAVHFTLEAGNGSLKQVDWDMVSRLSQTTGTPYINLHLDARQSYYPGLRVDTVDITEVDKLYEIIASEIMGVVDRFGPEHVIVENSPYHGTDGKTMRMCVLPDMITRVITETGCGLLLDIPHAIITSRSLGMQPDEYISKLPVSNTKEMHFAGIHKDKIDGTLVDHLSIQENDWYWLDWVLDHIHSGEWGQPWMLAFEYGGVGTVFEWRSDPLVIAEQVPQILEKLKSHGLSG